MDEIPESIARSMHEEDFDFEKCKKAATVLSEEQSNLLGDATVEITIHQNYTKAILILKNLITKVPNAPEVWLTLAMVYETKDLHKKAFGANIIAAHLKCDGDLFKQLGQISMNLNDIDQAWYCFKKAVQYEPEDYDAIWDYANLSYQKKQYKRAIRLFHSILNLVPCSIDVINELVKIYKKIKQPLKAIELYELAMEADKTNPPAIDPENMVVEKISLGKPCGLEFRMGYEELNSMADLYFEIDDSERTVVAIKEGIRRLKGLSSSILIARGDLEPSPQHKGAREQAVRRNLTAIAG